MSVGSSVWSMAANPRGFSRIAVNSEKTFGWLGDDIRENSREKTLERWVFQGGSDSKLAKSAFRGSHRLSYFVILLMS